MSARLAGLLIALCAVVGLQDRLPVDKLASARLSNIAVTLDEITEGLRHD